MPVTRYAKSIVAFLVAVVGGAIAQGLIVGASAAWCTVVIGAVTTAGVFGFKNQPADPDAGAVDSGSLALGLVLGILVAALLWYPR